MNDFQTELREAAVYLEMSERALETMIRLEMQMMGYTPIIALKVVRKRITRQLRDG